MRCIVQGFYFVSPVNPSFLGARVAPYGGAIIEGAVGLAGVVRIPAAEATRRAAIESAPGANSTMLVVAVLASASIGLVVQVVGEREAAIALLMVVMMLVVLGRSLDSGCPGHWLAGCVAERACVVVGGPGVVLDKVGERLVERAPGASIGRSRGRLHQARR